MDRNEQMAGLPLAMAYVPNQKFREIYDIVTGLMQGTIFKELDKPFIGCPSSGARCVGTADNTVAADQTERVYRGIDRGAAGRGWQPNSCGGNYNRYSDDMRNCGGRRR